MCIKYVPFPVDGPCIASHRKVLSAAVTTSFFLHILDLKHEVCFIFFAEEKVFTVSPHENANMIEGTRRSHSEGVTATRLLRVHMHALGSATVIISVDISELGCTQLVFVKPDTEIDCDYY